MLDMMEDAEQSSESMEKCQNRNTRVETKLIREMPKGVRGKVFDRACRYYFGKDEGLGSMGAVQVRSVSFKHRKITLDCRAM